MSYIVTVINLFIPTLTRPMHEGYLHRTNKIRLNYQLPLLKPKRPINNFPNSQKSLTESDEKTLLMELNDINESLHSKEFNYYSGNLFSCVISDKFLQELHNALVKKGMMLQEGFNFLTGGHQVEENMKVSNRVETFNEKIGKMSKKNVYDYDLNKYHILMQKNQNRWSLFKRADKNIEQAKTNTNLSVQHIRSTNHKSSDGNQSRNETQTEKNYGNSRKDSQMSTITKNSPSEKSIMEATNKISKIISPERFQGHNRKNFKKSRNQRILTEIKELQNPQNLDKINISKFELKNMLRKEGNKLVIMWLPPASYPQFNGIFSYSVSRTLTTCKLKKYFFFRRSLNSRFFDSVLQHLSCLEDHYMESIQILTTKQDFHKIFELVGWKMKSMEGMDKLRIKYSRKQI